jgi:hypothetical protein
MDSIDITLKILCTTCQTEKPLRYGKRLFTLSEQAMLEMRVDPDEFTLCPTCGNPLRLHIQAQPYELAHHVRPRL